MKYTWLILIQLCASIAFGQTMGARTGGGNLNNGLYNAANLEYIDILEATGAKLARVNLYPNDYWNFATNLPKTDYADSLLLYLAAKDIGVVLLFEHYADFVALGQPLGDYSKWQQIGAAFAQRYAPGSVFFSSNGFPGYGVQYYTAINEPDLGSYMPLTIVEDPENYHDALEGLADGVHSIEATLKVIPGGFATENSAGSHTLSGFGTAIADLFNNGKLYGIDLHTYNDVSYAPILKYDNTNHKQFMAFYDFNEVKIGCGITADIKFCATEFGFKENTQGIDASLAAKRLLTCIWGNLGAVSNDSMGSATEYALVWNLYNTVSEDPVYGMCFDRNPYLPSLKGQTFNLVMELAKDMDFEALDPFGRGEYILNGPDKKMWVLQNYDQLSTIFGSSYTIDQIPVNTVALQVYNWQGLLDVIPYTGFNAYTFTNLNVNETYMFVATADSLAGTSELSKIVSLSACPNPFTESITLHLPGNSHQIRICNSLGQLVETLYTETSFVTFGTNYPSGIYFAQLIGETGSVLRLIKE